MDWLLSSFFIALFILVSCDASGPSESEGDGDFSDFDGDVQSEADTDGDIETFTELTCEDNERCDLEFCDQVPIEAGLFTMGDHETPSGRPLADFGGLAHWGDQTPAHSVWLDAFCIDVYEVTYERYQACVDAGVCNPSGILYRPTETIINHYPPECEKDGTLCPLYPVNCKTPEQASTYCEWIGRRLCTEAEWERAATGSGQEYQLYPWGNETLDEERANFAGLGLYHLEWVGSYPLGVSSENVHNLMGNVYEWVADWYAPYEPDNGIPLENPTGPRDGDYRIARGGCFLSDREFMTRQRTTFDPRFDWG